MHQKKRLGAGGAEPKVKVGIRAPLHNQIAEPTQAHLAVYDGTNLAGFIECVRGQFLAFDPNHRKLRLIRQSARGVARDPAGVYQAERGMKNPCLDAALDELAKAGIRDVTRSYGGKHIQVRWHVNGHAPRFVSVSKTPSDFRSPENTRRDVRQLLREDGVITDPQRSAPPPKAPDRVTLLERRMRTLELEIEKLKSQVVGGPTDF